MRLVFGLLSVCFAASAAGQFTIEQVLSAPFPSDLVSDGRQSIAWIQNANGLRNIWVAVGPLFQARQLTKYLEDDGQEITELAISADGKRLVYTRGEGHNSSGESPNPRHLVAGVDQIVLTVPFAGGDPKELGKGHHPAISPDGQKVAFVSGGQVWSAPIAGSTPSQQLIHGRGTAEALEWSPDGKSLAITSNRSNHSFIAVFSAGDKTLRFLDPSTDMDTNPTWSPDSKQLAFIRQQVDLDELEFGPHRVDAEPWSIRVGDVATGAGKQLWKAQPGPGSRFHEISGVHQIMWANGDCVVFPWERTGWTHLYSAKLSGGAPVELTPGAFEVEQATLSTDRHAVLYSSNQDDIDRRHVWMVGASGGAPKRLTKGTDLEWKAIPVTAGVAMIHSDFRNPARVELYGDGEVRDLAMQAIPADFPVRALVEPQEVIFPAADGLPLHGQLFLPSDNKTPHPAVIFFHGGSRRQMLLGWHYMFYYNQAYGFNQYLASKGYVVLSVNYRSGIGYGLNFREALHYGADGASEFADVTGAGLYLRSRHDVVPNRIGLWGGSYGGFLTALGLARASDLFAAGVDLHGVHEWNEEMSGFVPNYQPEKRQEVARIAFESSPMAYIGTWRSPVLLIHGDDDRNVNFKQSIMLAQALRKQQVPFEELIFPDEIHDFLTHDHWVAAYRAADHFLSKYLTQ